MDIINSFTKDDIKAIRADMDEALATLANKHGMAFSIGRISYTANNFTAKVTGATIGKGGTIQTPGRIALKRRFPEYVDMDVILSNGLPGKVIEYHPRKRKFPFIVEAALGKTYKTTEAAILARAV
jgi:hypothetical protein